MKSSDRTIIRFGILAACVLPLLVGCGKSTSTANTATSSAPPPAVTATMPEQARAMAAQHAQGAEFDAKRRAAAMANTAPK